MTEEKATCIVVGGGIAAVSCVEQLAELCPNESIFVVSASRLVKIVSNWQKIGHAMESFDVEESSAESAFGAFRNVKVIPAFCSGFDHEKREVYTSAGKTFKYELLCLATGGHPKLLGDNPFVVGIRDTDSVRDFQSRLKNCRRLVVVGNGGIATELVYEVEKVEVVWVVKHKSVSATFVDAGAAEFFMSNLNSKTSEETPIASETAVYVPKKRLKYTHAGGLFDENAESKAAPGSALGPDWVEDLAIVGASNERHVLIEFESEIDKILSPDEFAAWERTCGRTVSHDAQWPVYVLLSSGKVYGCDLIVSATGVVPNSTGLISDKALLRLASDGGVLVDDQMRTSLPNVYAAGDLCAAGWPLSKHWFQMRLWTQARQMGAYTGRCMAMHWGRESSHMGLDICFEIFSHVTKFFGFKVVLLGLFNGQKLGSNYEALLRVKKGEEYAKVIISDDRVQGAMLIGETDLEETIENLILNGTDVSEIKDDLLNPTVDIEDYFD